MYLQRSLITKVWEEHKETARDTERLRVLRVLLDTGSKILRVLKYLRDTEGTWV